MPPDERRVVLKLMAATGFSEKTVRNWWRGGECTSHTRERLTEALAGLRRAMVCRRPHWRVTFITSRASKRVYRVEAQDEEQALNYAQLRYQADNEREGDQYLLQLPCMLGSIAHVKPAGEAGHAFTADHEPDDEGDDDGRPECA